MPDSGDITAVATVITALGGLVLAVAVLIPTLRASKKAVVVAQTAAAATSSQLDTIHTLVDGNLTAALRSEYEATAQQAVMMREVLDLRRALGHAPSAGAVTAIEAIEARLVELRASIDDRERLAPETRPVVK